MTTLVRGQIVVLVLGMMTLAGCQCSTDYGTKCTFRRSDGGTIDPSEVSPNTDVIDTSATECAKEVCFRQGDAGVPATAPVTGYCTGECISNGDCPGISGASGGTCADVVVSGVPGIPQGVKYCTYPVSP